MAMTAEPIKWMGSKLSKKQASAAIASDSATPGNIFTIFIVSLFVFMIGDIITKSKKFCKPKNGKGHHAVSFSKIK